MSNISNVILMNKLFLLQNKLQRNNLLAHMFCQNTVPNSAINTQCIRNIGVLSCKVQRTNIVCENSTEIATSVGKKNVYYHICKSSVKI